MNNRALLIEAGNGISGDMFVAAAAVLAQCEAKVLALPGQLGLDEVRCEFRDVVRSSLQCRRFEVQLGSHPAEDRATSDEKDHGGHGHHHHTPVPHGRHHTHGAGPQAHEHRSLSSIRAMIEKARLEPATTERAVRMFEKLGAVEAAAHGIPVEQVHFHEVGAVDSIVDIVAAAVCIERLQISRAFATPVCVGSGTVNTAHGQLPVPAPATEKLLHGFPTMPGDLPGEWTTPTGALILHELRPAFSIPTSVTLQSSFGGGAKDPAGRPNALRLRLVETAPAAADGLERDELCALYANIDDMPGELLGADLLHTLLQAGARDALVHSIVMKKGRPAHQLEVLVEPGDAARLAALIMTHTSTIGVRTVPVQRFTLPRETVALATPFGEVAAKRVSLPDGSTRILPEYEACRAIAEERGIPVQKVYRSALNETNP